MSRILAIEWDDQELRAMIATGSGRSVKIESIDALEIPGEEGSEPTPEQTGEVLKTWLQKQGGARGETLVAVGRASIELKLLQVPPAPEEELPDIVRFQAQREFTNWDENAPLDFLPLAGEKEGQRKILAATISRQLLEEVHAVCKHVGLKAERITLRPCATASAVRQSMDAGDCGVLIVDPLVDEVDLTVMCDGKVNFIRTVRLPHGSGDIPTAALVGQIRRTIAASQHQFPEHPISQIAVCGSEDQRANLASEIEKSLGLDTTVVNPLKNALGRLDVSEVVNLHPGRFASLLGMIHDESAGPDHAMDFLNPRRPPEPKSQRSTYMLAAAAVAALVLAYGWWQYGKIQNIKSQTELAQGKIKAQTPLQEKLAEQQEKAEAIDKWLASDVNWLAELEHVSQALRPKPLDAEDFPEDEDVLVTGLQLKALDQGGLITVAAAAKDSDVIPGIEARLRDEKHQVEQPSGQDDDSIAGYGYQFRHQVMVAADDPR